MHKQKPSYLNRKQKEQVNKKALIWVGAGLAAVIIAMALLLIFR